MGPAFSVLLPTHDRADVLGFAIRSVLAQTERDYELLVVGDGCTDDTAAVVRSFHDSRIRWFDLPKAPGFGYANRNVALREARGHLVAFMAHDDLILPDHLARMAGAFEDERVAWAYSRPVWALDDGVIIPLAIDLGRADHLEEFMTRSNHIAASCVVHRRSCLEEVGFWDEDIPSGGDWDLWKRIIGPSLGANVAYVRSATALHFRAEWKRGSAWAPPLLRGLQRTAALDASWPPALRVAVPEGASPQAATWQQIEADPVGWPSRLRAGIADAIEGLAWSFATARPRTRSGLMRIVVKISRAGLHDLAIELVDLALGDDPDDATLLGVRGRVLLNAGRTDEAEIDLRAAVRLDPSRPHPYGRLSQALGRQGRTAEAIDVVRAGLAARPDVALRHDTAWMHAHLGRLLRRAGDLGGAESALAASLEIDPDRDNVREELADLRARMAEG